MIDVLQMKYTIQVKLVVHDVSFENAAFSRLTPWTTATPRNLQCPIVPAKVSI